jgi:hypothetical protein
MNKQFWAEAFASPHGAGEINPAYGVWDWDLAGNVIYADEESARIFGVDAQLAKRGLPPESYFQSIHEDDRQTIIDHSLRSISTIGTCADNFRILDAAGTRWVHGQGRCFADRENKPKCFVGLVAEIGRRFETDRRALCGRPANEGGDDILYLSVCARRIAQETNRPFVAYLLDMAIAELTDLKILTPC